jgi:hypothetical protein
VPIAHSATLAIKFLTLPSIVGFRIIMEPFHIWVHRAAGCRMCSSIKDVPPLGTSPSSCMLTRASTNCREYRNDSAEPNVAVSDRFNPQPLPVDCTRLCATACPQVPLRFRRHDWSRQQCCNHRLGEVFKTRASEKSPDFIRLRPMPVDLTTIPSAFHPNAYATKAQVYDFTPKSNDLRYSCLTLVCTWSS